MTDLGKIYADGEDIVRQGETGNCMYVIQQGNVEIIRQEGDGEAICVGQLETGDLFGEMAIIERGEVRAATVRARGKVRVLTIDRRTFLRRVKEDPTLAFNVLQAMASRIRRLNHEVTALRQQRSPEEDRP
jgi:CRP-like cAMP-binding protein